MLSIKGREPFIRMQLWLADNNNVDRLQALKNERREANKRRRSSGPGVQDNSSDTSSNDTSEFYTSNSPGPGSVGSVTGGAVGGAPPNKKQRVLFSEEQKEALRLAFALDPYPNVATIEFLASELGLSTRTITNWFHNHRMRLKQQVPHSGPAIEPVPSRESQSGAPFDPVQFRLLLNQRLMELQKERMGLAGIPIPYPPYFAANPNLAALIGRGLFPTSEAELTALNMAFKEQMSGLDLSMSSLKRERDDEYDDDGGDGESHMSDDDGGDGGDGVDGDGRGGGVGIGSCGDSDDKSDCNKDMSSMASMQSRTSRRKPVAPQWVNPVWQDDKKGGGGGGIGGGLAALAGMNPAVMAAAVAAATAAAAAAAAAAREEEVIINGVCVMQQQASGGGGAGGGDFGRSSDETVRVEPLAAERYGGGGDDDEEDARSNDNDRASPVRSSGGAGGGGDDDDGAERNSETAEHGADEQPKQLHSTSNADENDGKVMIKNENVDDEGRDSERWEY